MDATGVGAWSPFVWDSVLLTFECLQISSRVVWTGSGLWFKKGSVSFFWGGGGLEKDNSYDAHPESFQEL